MSVFKLMQGYTPTILGASPQLVPREHLEIYRDQLSVRALQRLLKLRHPNTIHSHYLRSDTPPYYFYKSSKHCDRNEWQAGTVVFPQ